MPVLSAEQAEKATGGATSALIERWIAWFRRMCCHL